MHGRQSRTRISSGSRHDEGTVTDPGRAVFLSYASQDTEAAQNLCNALRAAGVEVWFDQSELRGGDAWDRQIRKQIHDCALFVPVISVHSDARHEGYFRREWKLAVDRTADMAEDVPFLLPVVIDSTADATARVPDRFREVQWTRLPGGETPAAFVERIKRLLSPERSPLNAVSGAAPGLRGPVRASRRSKPVLLAILAVVLAMLAYFVADKFWISKHLAASTAFNPPPHSIAVLPFANMSGDKEQEYFSDGLTEELLNSLAEINELQVAARTSAFSFKGKDTDIGTIARKLNVGAVLEGSVRRSAHTVRITAQLINAVTGYHLWSQTYDRNLGDILALQTEIANAVASALKLTLLGDVAAKIELGGTHDAAAFDAYLRASKAYRTHHDSNGVKTAISEYSEAIRLDPEYALAFAGRSNELITYAEEDAAEEAVRDTFDEGQADARKALALAPNLAEGHLALARFLYLGTLDFTGAMQEYERAMALAPGNARVVRLYGGFLGKMGRTDAGLAAGRRAIVLDPLAPDTHEALGASLFFARRYEQAVAHLDDAIALDSEDSTAYDYRGLAYYALGNFPRARASCEIKPEVWMSRLCLAMTYDKLARHADAEAVLAKLKASMGDASAYQYAEIYAQWRDIPKALEWLETALRLSDTGS